MEDVGDALAEALRLARSGAVRAERLSQGEEPLQPRARFERKHTPQSPSRSASQSPRMDTSPAALSPSRSTSQSQFPFAAPASPHLRASVGLQDLHAQLEMLGASIRDISSQEHAVSSRSPRHSLSTPEVRAVSSRSVLADPPPPPQSPKCKPIEKDTLYRVLAESRFPLSHFQENLLEQEAHEASDHEAPRFGHGSGAPRQAASSPFSPAAVSQDSSISKQMLGRMKCSEHGSEEVAASKEVIPALDQKLLDLKPNTPMLDKRSSLWAEKAKVVQENHIVDENAIDELISMPPLIRKIRPEASYDRIGFDLTPGSKARSALSPKSGNRVAPSSVENGASLPVDNKEQKQADNAGDIPVSTGACTPTSCNKCKVLCLQVQALAQSLAGLGSLVFNYSSNLHTSHRRILASMVLKYTQPCSHIDKALLNIVEELQSLFGDDHSATCSKEAKGHEADISRNDGPEQEASCKQFPVPTKTQAATSSQPAMPSPRGPPAALGPHRHVATKGPSGVAAHAWSRNIACNDAMMSEMSRDALTGRRGAWPVYDDASQPLIQEVRQEKDVQDSPNETPLHDADAAVGLDEAKDLSKNKIEQSPQQNDSRPDRGEKKEPNEESKVGAANQHSRFPILGLDRELASGLVGTADLDALLDHLDSQEGNPRGSPKDSHLGSPKDNHLGGPKEHQRQHAGPAREPQYVQSRYSINYMKRDNYSRVGQDGGERNVEDSDEEDYDSDCCTSSSHTRITPGLAAQRSPQSCKGEHVAAAFPRKIPGRNMDEPTVAQSHRQGGALERMWL